MLSEAIDNFYPSWIALEVLRREPMKESRVDADVNGLNSTSVSSIPADFGRLARRSQSEIPRAAERAAPAVSIPYLGLPRSASRCEYQPRVWYCRNLQVTAACRFQPCPYGQVSPVRSLAGTERRIREISLHLPGTDFHGITSGDSTLALKWFILLGLLVGAAGFEPATSTV